MVVWPLAVWPSLVQASLMVAVPVFVFQLMLQDQVIVPSSRAVFAARSFEVETVPLGSVTAIMHCAAGALCILTVAVCF